MRQKGSWFENHYASGVCDQKDANMFKILNLKICVAWRKSFSELLFAACPYSPVSRVLLPMRDQCPLLALGLCAAVLSRRTLYNEGSTQYGSHWLPVS